jgi:AraC-like DNA-binding protein
MKGAIFRIVSEYTQVFGLVSRSFYQTDDQINVRVRRNYNLSSLLDYLRMHYDQDMSLKEAAEMVNLSPNHLCKVFKKVTGKTLIEYIQHLELTKQRDCSL